MEVTQYLRQLTQRGEMYKYLNRYIIGFEDKYHAAYSGISDINEAMRIADGGRLTKTEEEKLKRFRGERMKVFTYLTIGKVIQHI